MTVATADWLPKAAFSESAVKAVLSGLVGGWSERWFARARASISAVRFSAATAQGDGAALELPGPGKRLLLEAALDCELTGQMLGEGDHSVLDVFAAQIGQDLITALDKLTGAGKQPSGSGCIALGIAVAGSDMLTVRLAAGALVPALKARLGGSRRAGAAPRSRVEALKQTRLEAEAILGRAELALGDLRELSVGDVLILDRALRDPVELRLADGGRTIGRGGLARNGGRISIQF